MATSYDDSRPNCSSRPRANSNTSRYIPDGYSILLPPGQPQSNDYLAPPGQPKQTQSQPESPAYQPIAPEQYRLPGDLRGVPPAQLPLDYPNTLYVDSDGHGTRPKGHRRHGSTDSRISGRSHVSSRSRRSHESDGRRHDHSRERRQDYDRDYDRDRDQHHRHKHSSDRDSLHDNSLKRRDTHRPGYGGTLFAIGSWVKSAFKGG